MSKGFNFEKNLPHQNHAVNSVLAVFDDVQIHKNSKEYDNPNINFKDDANIAKNISEIQKHNDIEPEYQSSKNILDIHMETGTGKTYTYTKTMFEINKKLKIFKFIVVVPTLSIKAGTVNFLKSESARQHFRGIYGKNINVHVVDSIKSKSKKKVFPSSISNFVRASNFGNDIHVLVINSGMINSESIKDSYDINLLDLYPTPIEAISACKCVTIIDEPHKFPTSKKTFSNVLKFNSQFIIRYGATFDNQYYNLLYSLNSIQAFNQDLVKGITVHIDEFETGKNEIIQLNSISNNEAQFTLHHAGKNHIKKLIKGESLDHLHSEIENLFIESMNTTKVILSNGITLKKGDKINPYSFSETIQNRMLQKAVKNHFKLEKEYLTRNVRIKPLTLFFIDDINSYRADNGNNGELAIYFESLVLNEINELLKVEKDQRYIEFLRESLKDISGIHGGYFSKDNVDKDDKIALQVEEIIHDKEKLIDVNNIRRFIFSKWTLREGWDNPNVFQICKLRSSGSETSKLQEVGRGLRIPVNEYMERVKNEQFNLHYFVDFTEQDFVMKLTEEINNNSLSITKFQSFNEDVIRAIRDVYDYDNVLVLEQDLFAKEIIDGDKNYTVDGYSKLIEKFPLITNTLKKGKVSIENETSNYTSIRKENFQNLKELWEEINSRVIIEYKFKDENFVKSIFVDSISEIFNTKGHLFETERHLKKVNESEITFDLKRSAETLGQQVSTMKYGEFLKVNADKLGINIETIHAGFIELLERGIVDINDHLNYETTRKIKQAFNEYILSNAFGNLEIKYNKISSVVHPTVLTDKNGNPLQKILASKVGVENDNSITPNDNYLYDECYFDSELERLNIITGAEIKEIIVYAKIPKGSIQIPIVGGGSYSPDFAYVVEFSDGSKRLNLIVETKDKTKGDLNENEKIKIAHAEELFKSLDVSIRFEKQLSNFKISNIINKILLNEEKL